MAIVEGEKEVVGEMLEGDERVEDMTEGQDESTDNPEPQDFTIRMASQSPTSSALFSDAGFPPSSDGGIEVTDIDDLVVDGDERVHLVTSGATRAKGSPGFSQQSKRRKRSEDGDDEREPI